MPRYKLTVAYEGTDYHGWQKQQPPDRPPLRTAQGVLEETVRAVVRQPITLTGASRTDSGVHALGQVAAFTANEGIPLDRLARAINSRLPGDMQVRRAEIVQDSFDPISDCTSKGYRYRLVHGCARRGRKPLFNRRFTAWIASELDVSAMQDAAQLLVGTHDFASFTRLHHGRESTVRTVHSCDVVPVQKSRLQMDIAGDGFLHNMIRIISGTLVGVGRGRVKPKQIEDILTARDRAAAGTTMPPQGLWLMWVRYPEHAAAE